MTPHEWFDGAQLRVSGMPVQQGSKGASARIVGGGKAIATLFDTNATKLKPWRANVANVARRAVLVRQSKNLGPLDGPLHCSIVFRFPMPASRPKQDWLRRWCWKVSAPDLDKLFRAVGDSLTDAKLIHDDARIVSFAAAKYETIDAHEVGCTIQIHTIDPAGKPPPIRPIQIPTQGATP
jgi:Holliday junction resolvase RusA-like endonuclease